jgi:hypothetical protein
LLLPVYWNATEIREEYGVNASNGLVRNKTHYFACPLIEPGQPNAGRERQTRVTLKNLDLFGAYTEAGSGGAIMNTVNMTVEDSVIRNNLAPYGGGVANAGNLTLKHVTVRDNWAVQGAGVYNYGRFFSVRRHVRDLSFSGDSETHPSQRPGNLTLINTSIESNTAATWGWLNNLSQYRKFLAPPELNASYHSRGGGLFNAGELALINTVLKGNQVQGGTPSDGPSYWSTQAVTVVLPLPIGTYVPYAFSCARATSYATTEVGETEDDSASSYLDQIHVQANCDFRRFGGMIISLNPPSVATDFPYQCPSGFYGNSSLTSNQSSQSCTGPCPPGFYCPGPGCKTPLNCPPGFYAPSSGLAHKNQCLQCPQGHWCGKVSVEPLQCDAGRRGDKFILANASCAGTCPLYHYCPKGSTSGILCPDGTFGNSTGLRHESDCSACPPGHWCNSGVAYPCQEGYYSSGGNKSITLNSCKACPDKSTTLSEASSTIEDCLCVSDYYDSNGLVAEVVCKPKPAGSFAPTGTLATTLTVKAKYWRADDTSEVRECPYPNVCKGGVMRDQNYSANSSVLCSNGTCGAFCRLCCHPDPSKFDASDDGPTYFDAFHQRCEPCDVSRASTFVILGPLIGVLVLMGMAWHITWHGKSGKLTGLRIILRDRVWWRRLALFIHQFGLRTKLKIVISTLQIVTQLGSVYMVQYPSSYGSLIDRLKMVNALLLTQIPGLDPVCVHLSSLPLLIWFTLLASLLVPLIALAGAHFLCQGKPPLDEGGEQKKKGGVEGNKASKGIYGAIPFSLVWSFLALPFVSSLGFRSLAPCDCMGSIGTETQPRAVAAGPPSPPFAPPADDAISDFFGVLEEKGVCFCRQDYSVRCYEPDGRFTPEYADVRVAAWFCVVIYAGLVPLLYTYLLFRCRTALREGRPSQLSSALKFLHDEYSPHFYLWELIEILRKLILIGFLVFVWTGTIMQLFAALIIAIFFFALQLSAQPYKLPSSNFLGTVGAASITFTFVSTLAFQSLPLLTLEGDDERVDAEKRGNAENFISGLLSLAALAVIAGLTVVIFSAAAAERFKSKLLWKTDKAVVEAPSLPETDQKRFHCFISHCWASGQADARSMKASLTNFVRDLHVFLDVDDLDDIGNLETFVDASHVLVVLLSGSVDDTGSERSDYFNSHNCLRELQRAIESKLEILFVYEPKAAGEGCTMETHLATCPEGEMRDTLAKGYIVPWYRVKNHQNISLLNILKRVYAVAPSRKRSSDRFYHRDDSTRKALPMRPPRGSTSYHLYVSPFNEGAFDAAGLLNHFLRQRRIATGGGSPLGTTPRLKELNVTSDIDQMASGQVEHFLFVVSASLFDDTTADPAMAAKAAALFSELRIALQNNVHIFVVHDCRDAFEYHPPTSGGGGSSGDVKAAAVARTPAQRAAQRPAQRRGSVRNAVQTDGWSSGWRNVGRRPSGDKGKARASEGYDGFQDAGRGTDSGELHIESIGRFVPFKDILNKMPKDLVMDRKLFQELALPLYGHVADDPYLAASVDMILRAILSTKSYAATPLLQNVVLVDISKFAKRWLGKMGWSERGNRSFRAQTIDSDARRGGERPATLSGLSSVRVDSIRVESAHLMAGKAASSSDPAHQEDSHGGSDAGSDGEPGKKSAFTEPAGSLRTSEVSVAASQESWPVHLPPFVSHVGWPAHLPPFVSHVHWRPTRLPPFVSYNHWPVHHPPFISYGSFTPNPRGSGGSSEGSSSSSSSGTGARPTDQSEEKARLKAQRDSQHRSSKGASQQSARASMLSARVSVARSDAAIPGSRPSQSRRTSAMSALRSGSVKATSVRPAADRANTSAAATQGAGKSSSAKVSDSPRDALLGAGGDVVASI